MKGSKKKAVFITAVIAVMAVILAAGWLIAGALIPPSLEGDWELVVNPEISKASTDQPTDAERVFYSFTPPDSEGKGSYRTFFEGGVEEGAYRLTEKDGNKLINLGTIDLEYTLTGSQLFGSGRLTIIYPEQTNTQTAQTTPAQAYIFEKAKAPEYEKAAYSSFNTDKMLLTEWMTTERTLAYEDYTLSYTESVCFSPDGIMTIHYKSTDLVLDRVLYYAYSAKDGLLTFSPVTDQETKYSVSYQFDSSGYLHFPEDETASSIFADAIFSDVPYYPANRLSGAFDSSPSSAP